MKMLIKNFIKGESNLKFCLYRSKAYMFEEFLSSWYEKLKSEEPTTMTVRLQKDIDKYKVCNDSYACKSLCSHNSEMYMFFLFKRTVYSNTSMFLNTCK